MTSTTMGEPYVLQASGASPKEELAEIQRARIQHRWAVGPLGRTFLSHGDCSTLLREPRLGAIGIGMLLMQGITQGPFFEWFSRLMFSASDADSRRLRSLVGRSLSPDGLAPLRPKIRAIVKALFSKARGHGPIDLRDIAHWLPLQAMCEVLGIAPEEGARRFDAFPLSSARIFNFAIAPEVLRDLDRSIVELSAYIGEHLEARRREPRQDLISHLLKARDEAGGKLSEEELVALIANLFIGSTDTVEHACCVGTLLLLEHREAWDRLGAEPSLVPSAIEEMLRYEPALGMTARVARQEISWDGVTFQPGEVVAMSLLAANHDPAVFPDPDRFDVTRDDRRHLGFGGGLHVCLGLSMARLVLTELFAEMTHEYPRTTLAMAPHEVLRSTAGLIRTPTKLLVQLD
jgi:cytochrome P450 family 103